MTNDDREDLTINDPTEVPDFATEADEVTFWSEHELGGDLLARMARPPEGLLPAPRPRAKPISLRMEPDLLASLKAEAKKRGLPYQSLLKQFVSEQLAIQSYVAVERRATPVRSDSASPLEWGDSLAVTFPRLSDQRRVCRRVHAIRGRGHVLDFAA